MASQLKKLGCVALLPIKANSERVSNKNFREIAGKPLCLWIIDTLKELKEIDLIVINTDARDQLKACGVFDTQKILIRDRKEQLCGDLVSMNKIIEDDINAINSDFYLMTHVTNPLIKLDTIRDAIIQFKKVRKTGNHDSLFSVTRVQSRFYLENGEPVNHDPKNLIRTQDLEPWFEENSNFYIFDRKSFSKTSARIGASPILYEVSKVEAIDIDNIDDWYIAEGLLSKGFSQ